MESFCFNPDSAFILRYEFFSIELNWNWLGRCQPRYHLFHPKFAEITRVQVSTNPQNLYESTKLVSEVTPSSNSESAADDLAVGWLGRVRRRLWVSRVPVTVLVSLLVFGFQAVHSILLARLLGPAGRGEYGTIVLYAQTMLYIGLLGTHYSIARSAANETQYHSLQLASFRIGLLTGIGSAAIAVLLNLFCLPAEKQYLLPLALICTLMLPCEHLRLTAQSVDHGRGTFNRYNASRLFAAAIFPVLMLALFMAEIRDLRLIAWATVATSAFGYIFYWAISDCKPVWGNAGKTRVLELIKDGRSDGALVLANDLFDRLATLLVLWLVGFKEQGFYLTALPAATLLLVAPNAFELFTFRRGANKSRNVTRGEFFKYGALFFLAQVIVSISMILAVGPLIRFVYSDAYAGSIPIAKVLVAAMAANGLTIIGEGYLRGRSLARQGVTTRIIALPIMLVTAFAMPGLNPTLRIAVAVLLGHLANASLVAWCVYRDISTTAPLAKTR